jgi:hypothetical protein
MTRVAGALLALLASSVAVASAPVTADQLLRQIEAEGARQVLQRLWENEDQFGHVCGRIESADPRWLEVARRLKPSSDASLSLGLNYAVARALVINPTRVLKLINHGFTVDDVCTSPFIEPDPGVAERYQRRASAALRRPTDGDLEAVRKECLKLVEMPLKAN